jgi:hypothetical protein
MLWSPKYTQFLLRDGTDTLMLSDWVLNAGQEPEPSDLQWPCSDVGIIALVLLQALKGSVRTVPSHAIAPPTPFTFTSTITALSAQIFWPLWYKFWVKGSSGLCISFNGGNPYYTTKNGRPRVPPLLHAPVVSFDDLAGFGAVGRVYRNRYIGAVVKVYGSEDWHFMLKEAEILRRTSEMTPRPTPRIHGLYIAQSRGFLIMDDGGEPIGSLNHLNASQR